MAQHLKRFTKTHTSCNLIGQYNVKLRGASVPEHNTVNACRGSVDKPTCIHLGPKASKWSASCFGRFVPKQKAVNPIID